MTEINKICSDTADPKDKAGILFQVVVNISQIIKRDAIDEWWNMPMERLDGKTPRKMIDKDPIRVLKLTESYLDTSFG